MEYLKEEQYYIDRYDLFTIKKCIEIVEFWQKLHTEKFDAEELKGLSPEDKEKDFNLLFGRHLNITKGEEYRRKKETIQKWMNEDRIKQEKLDSTPEPLNISCSECGKLMKGTMKHLEDYKDQPYRVLFFFECSSCKKKKGIFENREEHISKPHLCSKCQTEVTISVKETKKKLTWTYTCPSCGFKELEVDDFEKKRAEWKEKDEFEKKLLEQFRKEFCFSDKEGEEYITFMEASKYAKEVFEQEKQKYDDSAYQVAASLKKISIVDLEKLLNETLEKEKYTKLTLEKPEMGQYVIVPFSAQDADSSRKEYISVSSLEKLIKDVLEETNWRLMSDGIQYRLGYLSGRLRGYEREEDLMEISGKKREQKPKEDDYDRRMQYGSQPIVQLARHLGKLEGIDNTRKKRLEKEPNGFFLEASEGPYTCAICRQNHPGNNIWWTVEALRCADCWRNIQAGVIPPLAYKNEGIWMEAGDFKSDYSVQPMTRKRLEREGLLHGRELKRPDGTVYCIIYLIEENKEFFEKYPKKPELDLKLYWSPEHKSLMLDVKKIEYPVEEAK